MNKRVKRAALRRLFWASFDYLRSDNNVDQYDDLICYPITEGVWP